MYYSTCSYSLHKIAAQKGAEEFSKSFGIGASEVSISKCTQTDASAREDSKDTLRGKADKHLSKSPQLPLGVDPQQPRHCCKPLTTGFSRQTLVSD